MDVDFTPPFRRSKSIDENGEITGWFYQINVNLSGNTRVPIFNRTGSFGQDDALQPGTRDKIKGKGVAIPPIAGLFSTKNWL
jgi:hypothetical protein